MKTLLISLILILVLLLNLGSIACGGGGEDTSEPTLISEPTSTPMQTPMPKLSQVTTETATSEPTPTPEIGFGKLEIRATDAPPSGVSQIWVNVNKIEVHKADVPEDMWVVVVDHVEPFDLVAIQGAEALLGKKEMEAGQYTQIRLDVAEVQVVMQSGEKFKAELPGEKMKVVGPWDVKKDERTILTLDFDAEKFVVITGAKQAHVKPVIGLEVTHGDRPLKESLHTPEPALTPSPKPSTEPPPPGEPGRPLPEITPDEHSDWAIPTGSGTNYRAVHMGGNWGTNRDAVKTLPEEYFTYLRDLNVDWVGISVALHLDGSMDSTVELDYNEHLYTPTFRDDVLREMISTFRSHGFNVYIHAAIDAGMGGEYPVQRWQLGDPLMHSEDPNISPDAWPWRTDHPQHQEFVAEFWQTHTDSLVHIARIAEEEGAGMLTLGTEMNRLYRSRSGGRWPNHFLNEMRAMVSAVRDVYHGQLGYEMHYGALLDRDLYGPGSDYIHDDLDLDFIAVSVYMPLMDSVPDEVPTVGELEGIWDSIFNQHLKPLQERNGNRPIVFTEFGYTDSVQALLKGDNDSFVDKTFKDKDGDGLDDGEEVQANIYEAIFNTMDRHPGLLAGTFLWDVMMDTEENYQAGFAKMRSTNIRGKIAEEVVRDQYAEWR